MNRHTKENDSHANITRSCPFPINQSPWKMGETAGGYGEEIRPRDRRAGPFLDRMGFSNCLHFTGLRLFMYWPTSSSRISGELHQGLIGSITSKETFAVLHFNKRGRLLSSATLRNWHKEEAKAIEHHMNYLSLPTANCSYVDTCRTEPLLSSLLAATAGKGSSVGNNRKESVWRPKIERGTIWTDPQDQRNSYRNLGSSVHCRGSNSHRALEPCMCEYV